LTATQVGVIGGGQLGRMLLEAALALDIPLAFYVRPSDEGVRGWAATVVEGEFELAPLLAFAELVDVVTFEHELVPPPVLRALEQRGVVLRPSARVMEVGSDKWLQRSLFATLGLAGIPAQLVDRGANELPRATPPYVLKARHGGYDGRGVHWIQDVAELPPAGHWLAEPVLELDAEGAVLVARGLDGSLAVWEPVRLINREGICVEASWPSGFAPRLRRAAHEAATAIAEQLEAVGVLALEFFVIDGELVLNELAPRVHNSGHLTIEGARTSQFENHLRAIAGLALGDTSALGAAVMVNVLGGARTPWLPSDVRVHRYGKTPRPRRKVAHVTAVGPDLDDARQRARRAARLLGGELVEEVAEP